METNRWLDLGTHHSGIDSLRLAPEVAAAWKRRQQTRTKTTTTGTGEKVEVTVERFSYLDTLACVRAFYLDLAQWALEDPDRWGRGWRRARSPRTTCTGGSWSAAQGAHGRTEP